MPVFGMTIWKHSTVPKRRMTAQPVSALVVYGVRKQALILISVTRNRLKQPWGLMKPRVKRLNRKRESNLKPGLNSIQVEPEHISQHPISILSNQIFQTRQGFPAPHRSKKVLQRLRVLSLKEKQRLVIFIWMQVSVCWMQKTRMVLCFLVCQKVRHLHGLHGNHRKAISQDFALVPV